MKTIIEGVMSTIDLDRQEMTPKEFRKTYPQLFNSAKTNEKHNELYKGFVNYVNKSRSKWEILPDGEFTGSYDVLKSFKTGYEKSHNVIVKITDKYIDGEYIPYLLDVTKK